MPCALLLGVAATTRSSTTVWKPAKPQYCLAAARITRWWPTTSFPRASRTTARTTPCGIIQNSSTDVAAPSPVHLSLQPAHRRGWASFYAALARGRIDAEVLRELLVRHPLAGSAATPVYAVDTSVWSRCDAEASPGRGYYYHPSRHSSGQPIVACSGPTSWSPGFPSSEILGWRPWTPGASGGGRQRRGGGAGKGVVGALVAPRCPAPVRLRRGLRPRQAAARLGGSPRARPGEAALQPRLLRRPRRGRAWPHPLERVWCISIRSWLLLCSSQLC